MTIGSAGTRPAKHRVFIGIQEFADLGLLLALGLREAGLDASTVMLEQPGNPRRPYGPDSPSWNSHDSYIRDHGGRLAQLWSRAKTFSRAITGYDTFIYLGASSFFDFVPRRFGLGVLQFLDWRLARSLGKTVVVISTGTDLRSYPAMVRELKQASLSSHAKYCEREIGSYGWPDAHQKSKADHVQHLAHHIFSQPNMAQHLTRAYHFLWVPADLSRLAFEWPESTKPLVLHAPSRRVVKGTQHVLECVDRLQREGYDFRFQLLENLDNEQTRRLLAQSHLVIDQVLLPAYGLLAIEAMATGNVVVGSAVPGYGGFPDDLPMITSTPDDLHDNLASLLDDRERWYGLARRGREYVEAHHDYRRIGKDIAAVLMGCDEAGLPDERRLQD